MFEDRGWYLATPKAIFWDDVGGDAVMRVTFDVEGSGGINTLSGTWWTTTKDVEKYGDPMETLFRTQVKMGCITTDNPAEAQLPEPRKDVKVMVRAKGDFWNVVAVEAANYEPKQRAMFTLEQMESYRAARMK